MFTKRERNLKIFNGLLIIELLLLIGLMVNSPLVILERVVAMGVLLYLNFVCYISTNNSPITELLGFVDNSDYYQTYLNLVIDTLKIADKAIHKANLIDNEHDYRVRDCIEIVGGCSDYLKTIEPPKKYNKYHKNILDDLDFFLKQYSYVKS